MGSRSGRHAPLAVVLAAALAACGGGAPHGFSGGKGDRWSAPLIGPYEDGVLLVPVIVDGRGSYVFAVDPDAPVSIVDDNVVKEAGLATGNGPKLLDEAGQEQTRIFAELKRLEIGSLVIEKQMPAMVVKPGAYDVDGRLVQGVLGRDVLADSLVFGFDRETGLFELSTEKAFKVPPDAIAVRYEPLFTRMPDVETPPLGRRIAPAMINGQKFEMHLDLGAKASQLHSRAWAKAGLESQPVRALLVDEVGSGREITASAIAAEVKLGGVTTRDVPFVPFTDSRWPDHEIDGALGLSFFRDYTLWLSLGAKMYFLVPRKPQPLDVRLDRWQSKIVSKCPHPACITVNLVDPLAGKPADQMPAKHPGLVVSFVKDPDAVELDLEVLVAVTPAPGRPALQWLAANIGANVPRAMTHLPADYLGATLTVVDASPFPRACGGQESCIDLILAPRSIAPAPPSASLHEAPAASCTAIAACN